MKKVIVNTFIFLLFATLLLACIKQDEGLEDGTFGLNMSIISGNSQEASRAKLFQDSLTVQVADDAGKAISGMKVAFYAIPGDDGIAVGSVKVLIASDYTNASGIARTEVKAGFTSQKFKLVAEVADTNIKTSFDLSVVSGPTANQPFALKLITMPRNFDALGYDDFDRQAGIEVYSREDAGNGNPTSIANHQLFGYELDANFNLLAPSQTPTVPAQMQRNYVRAGVDFALRITIVDAEGYPCDKGTAAAPEEIDIVISHDVLPSWTGKLSKLPPNGQTIKCPFVQGICVPTDQNGERFIYNIKNRGIARFWVSDAVGEVPYSASGVEVLVEQNVDQIDGLVLADRLGGPSWNYRIDPTDSSRSIRENNGANIYQDFSMVADNNSIQNVFIANVDASGNYRSDFSGAATWSTDGDNIFTGNTYSDPNATTAIDLASNNSFYYRPKTAGSSVLIVEGSGLTQYTSFQVKPRRPHHLRASTNVPTDGSTNDAIWAGVMSPIDIAIEDEYDNVCTDVNGQIPVKMQIDRFNAVTDPNTASSITLANSSGYYAVPPGEYNDLDTSGAAAFTIIKLAGIGQEYEGNAITNASNDPNITMTFINGVVSGTSSSGLQVLFKDASYTPYIHVETDTNSFNDGEIIALQRLMTEDWNDIDPNAQWEPDASKVLKNPISIYRDVPSRLVIRAKDTNDIICHNGVYTASSSNKPQTFELDACNGIASSSVDDRNYKCVGDKDHRPCQTMNTSNQQLSYVVYYEDKNGNPLDADPNDGQNDIDPVEVLWTGRGSLDTTINPNIITTSSTLATDANVSPLAQGPGDLLLIKDPNGISWTKDDGTQVILNDQIQSSYMFQINPGGFENLKLSFSTLDASDSNQYLIIKAVDIQDNWIDFDTDDPNNIRIYLLDDTLNSSPLNERPFIRVGDANVFLDAAGAPSLRDTNTMPLNFDRTNINATDPNWSNFTVELTNLTREQYTGVDKNQTLTKWVYKIPVLVGRAFDQVKIFAATQIDTDRFAFSETAQADYTFTFTPGAIDKIFIHSTSDPTDANDFNYTWNSDANQTQYSNPPSADGDANFVKLSNKKYRFTADHDDINFCMLPYDRRNNLCLSCLDNGSGTFVNKFKAQKSTSGTINIVEASQTLNNPNPKEVFDSSILYKTAYSPYPDSTNNKISCINVNFNNVANQIITAIPVDDTTVEDLVDNRQGTLNALWQYPDADGNNVNVSNSIEIDIIFGKYAKLKFNRDESNNVFEANDIITVDSNGLDLGLLDKDDNPVTSNADGSDNDQNILLDFYLTDSSQTDLAWPNIKPDNGNYLFSRGQFSRSVDSLTYESFKVVQTGDDISLKVKNRSDGTIYTYAIDVKSGAKSQLITSCPESNVSAGVNFNCTVKVADLWGNPITADADSNDGNNEKVTFQVLDIDSNDFDFIAPIGLIDDNGNAIDVNDIGDSNTITGRVVNGQATITINTTKSDDPNTNSWNLQVTAVNEASDMNALSEITVVPADANYVIWDPNKADSSVYNVGDDWGNVIRAKVYDQYDNLLWNDSNTLIKVVGTDANGTDLDFNGTGTVNLQKGFGDFDDIAFAASVPSISVNAIFDPNGANIRTSNPFDVTINTGNIRYAVVVLPGQQLVESQTTIDAAITGDPNDYTAGDSFNVKVYYLDGGFNIVTSDNLDTVPFGLDFTDTGANTMFDSNVYYATDGQSSDIPVRALSASKGTPRSIRVESQLCSASVLCPYSSEYEISIGAASKLLVKLPGQNTFNQGEADLNVALPEDPNNQTAGVFFDGPADGNYVVEVYVTDEYHNIDPNSDANVVISFPNDNFAESTKDPNGIEGGLTKFAAVNYRASLNGVNTKEQFINASCVGCDPALSDANSVNYQVLPADANQSVLIFEGQTHAPGDSNINLSITGTPTNWSMCDQYTVTVKIVDQYFNTVSGQTGSVTVSTNDASAEPNTITKSLSATQLAQLEFGLRSLSVGSYTITQDTNIAGLSNNTNNNSYSSVMTGNAEKILVRLPGQSYTPDQINPIIGTISDQVAGIAFNLELFVTNSCNALVSGNVVDINVTSNRTDPNEGEANFVDTNQVFDFTNFTADSNHQLTVSATLDGNAVTAKSGFYKVDPADANRVIVILPGQSYNPGTQTAGSAISGDPNVATAGLAFNADIRIVDRYYNTVTTAPADSNVALTTSDPNDNNPSAIDLGNILLPEVQSIGYAQFAITNFKSTGGQSTATITSESNLFDTTSSGYAIQPASAARTILVLPGQTHNEGYPNDVANVSLAVTGNPNDAVVDANYIVDIKVIDAYYNTVNFDTNTRYNGSYKFESNDVYTNLPADGNFSDADSNGIISVIVKEQRKTAKDANTRVLQLQTALEDLPSSAYEVRPGVATSLIVLLDGQTLTEGKSDSFTEAVSGTPTTQVVGVAHDVNVIMVDKYFNQTEDTNNVSLDVDGNYITFTPANDVLVEGIRSFSVTNFKANQHPNYPGTITLKASDLTGITEIDSSSYNINAADANRFVVVMPGQSLSQGMSTINQALGTPNSIKSADSFSPTISLVDYRYNIINDSNTVIDTFTAQDNQGNTLDVSFDTNASGPLTRGEREITLSNMVRNPNTIIVFDSNHATVATGNSQQYAVTTGDFTKFIITIGDQNYVDGSLPDSGQINNQVAGSGIPVSVYTTDAVNNLVDYDGNLALTFQYSGTGATPAPISLLIVPKKPDDNSTIAFTDGRATFDANDLDPNSNAFVLYNILDTPNIRVATSDGIIGTSGVIPEVEAANDIASITILDSDNNDVTDNNICRDQDANVIKCSTRAANDPNFNPTMFSDAYDKWGNTKGRVNSNWLTTGDTNAVLSPSADSNSTTLMLSDANTLPGTMNIIAQLPSDTNITDDVGNFIIYDRQARSFALDWNSIDTNNIAAGDSITLGITAQKIDSTTATEFSGDKVIAITSNAEDTNSVCDPNVYTFESIDGNSVNFTSGVGSFRVRFVKAQNGVNISTTTTTITGKSSDANVVSGSVGSCYKIRSAVDGGGSIYTDSDLTGENAISSGQDKNDFFVSIYDTYGNFMSNPNVAWVVDANSVVQLTSTNDSSQAAIRGRKAGVGFLSTPNDITAHSLNIEVVPSSTLASYIALLQGQSYSTPCSDSNNPDITTTGNDIVTAGEDISVNVYAVDAACNPMTNASNRFFVFSFDESDDANAPATSPNGTAATPDPNATKFISFGSDGMGTFEQAAKVYRANDSTLEHRLKVDPCIGLSCASIDSNLITYTPNFGVKVADSNDQITIVYQLDGGDFTISSDDVTVTRSTDQNAIVFGAKSTDQYGNLDSDANVQWSLLDSNDSLPLTVLGDANIRTQMDYTTGVGTAFSGTIKLEAKLASDTNITDQSGPFTLIEQGASSYGISFSQATPQVGEDVNIIIQAEDSDGNDATNYAGTKKIRLTVGGENNATSSCNSSTLTPTIPATNLNVAFTDGVGVISGLNFKNITDQISITLRNRTDSNVNRLLVHDAADISNVALTRGERACVKFMQSTGSDATEYDETVSVSIPSSINVFTSYFDAFNNFIEDANDLTWNTNAVDAFMSRTDYDSPSSRKGFTADKTIDTNSISIANDDTNDVTGDSLQITVTKGVASQYFILLPGDQMTGGVGTYNEAFSSAARETIIAGTPVDLTVVATDARYYAVKPNDANNLYVKFDLRGETAAPRGTNFGDANDTNDVPTLATFSDFGQATISDAATFYNVSDTNISIYTDFCIDDSNCTTPDSNSITTDFTIKAGQANYLDYSTTTKTLAAGEITDAVTIVVRDNYGNLTVVDTNTTISLSDTADSNNQMRFFERANLLDPNVASVTMVQDTNRVDFYFSDTYAHTATIRAQAADSNLTNASQGHSITNADGNYLSFERNNNATFVAGALIGPIVRIYDQYNNLVTTGDDANNLVTLSVTPSTTMDGNTAINAVDGVANFVDVAITTTNTNYVLSASDDNNDISDVTDPNSFAVTNTDANQIAFGTNPNSTYTAGETIITTVRILDRYNNLVTTGADANDQVSVALDTNTFASGTTTKNAVDGIADFNDLVVTIAKDANYVMTATHDTNNTATAQFRVTNADANRILFSTNVNTSYPAGSSIAPVVSIVDQYDNPVTIGSGNNAQVKLTINQNTESFGGDNDINAISGSSTFDVNVTTAATGYRFTANVLDVAGLATVDSNSFNVTNGAANYLTFSTSPNDTYQAGDMIEPVISVFDVYDNPVLDREGNNITLSANPNNLRGTTSASIDANGIASFASSGPNIIVAQSTPYVLTATFAPTTSITVDANVTITPNDPNQLKITLANAADNSSSEFTTGDYSTSDASPNFIAKVFDRFDNYINDSNDLTWSNTNPNYIILDTTTDTNLVSFDYSDPNMSSGITVLTATVTSDTNFTDSTGNITIRDRGIRDYNVTAGSTVSAGNDLTVTIQALDSEDGNVITAYNGLKRVIWSTTATDGTDACQRGISATLTGPSGEGDVNFINGSGTVTYNLKKAESATITAVDARLSDVNDVSNSITVNALDTNCISLGDSEGASLGNSIDLPLGNTLDIYSYGYDIYGNPNAVTTTWRGTGIFDRAPYPFSDTNVTSVTSTHVGYGSVYCIAATCTDPLIITTPEPADSKLLELIANKSFNCQGQSGSGCFTYDNVDLVHYWDVSDSENDYWRQDTSASWYTETLGDDDRGERQEFPTEVFIVVNSNNSDGKIYIIDATTNKMFMVFNRGKDFAIDSAFAEITALDAQNGKIFVAGDAGLLIFDFANDRTHSSRPDSEDDTQEFRNDISRRNTTNAWTADATSGSNDYLPEPQSGNSFLRRANSLTSLSAAKIGNNYYLAIGTNGDGASIVGFTANGVNYTLRKTTTTDNVSTVKLMPSGDFYYTKSASTQTSLYYQSWDDNPTNWPNSDSANYLNQFVDVQTYAIDASAAISSVAVADPNSNVIYLGTNKGLFTVHEANEKTDPSLSTIAAYSPLGAVTVVAGADYDDIAPSNGVVNFGDDQGNTAARLQLNDAPTTDANQPGYSFKFMAYQLPSSDATLIMGYSSDIDADAVDRTGEFAVTLKSDGLIEFTVYDLSALNTISTTSTSAITPMTWHQVTIAMQGNFGAGSDFRLWLDGNFIDVAGNDSERSYNPTYRNLVIGGTWNGQNLFNGAIDELIGLNNSSCTPISAADMTPACLNDLQTNSFPAPRFVHLFDGSFDADVGSTTIFQRNAATTAWLATPLYDSNQIAITDFDISTRGPKVNSATYPDPNSTVEAIIMTEDQDTNINTFLKLSNIHTTSPSSSSYGTIGAAQNISNFTLYRSAGEQADPNYFYDMLISVTGADSDPNNGMLLVRGAPSFTTVGSNPSNAGTSCLNILTSRPNSPDGWYWITTSSNGTFNVYCDMMNGGWTRLHYEDPRMNPEAGWSVDTIGAVTWAGGGSNIHGPWDGNTRDTIKTFTMKGVSYTDLRVTARYFAGGTWDNGEYGRFRIDNETQWTMYHRSDGSGPNDVEMINVTSFEPSAWSDQRSDGYWLIDETMTPTGDTNDIVVRFSGMLSNITMDEVWGFDNLILWVR